MKSIKTKIQLTICLVTAISLLTTAVITSLLNYLSTVSVLEQSIRELVDIASERISYQFMTFTDLAKDTGTHSVICDPNASVEEKQAVIDSIVQSESMVIRGNVLGADGISIFSGQDFNDREYFHESMNGNTWISDPLVSKVTGELSIIVSAPIRENASPNGKVIGVIYFVPVESILIDAVASMKISESGSAQVINKSGTIVAHPNIEMIRNNYNSMEESKSDPSLQQLALLESDAVKGNSGFGTYSINGVDKFLAYAPIAQTNGWSLGVNAPISDFTSGTIQSAIITLIILIISLITSFIIAMIVANRITKPILISKNRLSLLAQGDVTTPVPEPTTKDEAGQLLRDLGICVNGLSAIVKDIDYHLGEMANSNLTTVVSTDYPGDFSRIRSSLTQIISSFNLVVGDIVGATNQVAGAADEMSGIAQDLAQTSTQQAEQILSLSHTLENIKTQAIESADITNEVETSSRNMQHMAQSSSKQIKDMIKAVQEINEASQSIGKVIKSIDDIAFQTNILALNAAVEAARAGEHGKGFAVVADEVRNLASKSAEAAKSTAGLIQDTITKAAEGYSVSMETSKSISQIIDNINQISGSIETVTRNSAEQADAIAQISGMLGEQSNLVQVNTATSEETAATSEELNGQAILLKEYVSKFRLA